MSVEVLITMRQRIFIFFASAWICKKIKNPLSHGYQDLTGHLILTTSSWSILTWITLVRMVKTALPGERRQHQDKKLILFILFHKSVMNFSSFFYIIKVFQWLNETTLIWLYVTITCDSSAFSLHCFHFGIFSTMYQGH